MADQPLPAQSTRGLPEVILHQIAQAMVFAKHGDWRYDPGDPKYDKWLDRAKQFASAARIGYERISNDDGAGSWPPQASDHPETYSVRLVGGWVLANPAESDQERHTSEGGESNDA